MPRGTVHQAVACEDGSSHLTISTYQRWSLGDLAQHIISVSADGQHNAEGACWPLALRKGLPIGFLQDCGLMADVGAGSTNQRSVDVATSVAAGLRALADQLEAMPQQLISMAADSIAADFIKSRLPAHPDQLPKKGGAHCACCKQTMAHCVVDEGPVWSIFTAASLVLDAA